MIENKFLNELNEKQVEAVSAPRKPLLMLAGPGTGKTRTLIARIIFELKNHQIPADNILALTFSNKAADEIKQRLLVHLQDDAAKIRTGTFHSFCLDILRKYPETAGLHKHFSVCDDDYQMRLLKDLLLHRVRENIDKKARGILLAFSNHVLKGKNLPAFSASIYEQYIKHLTKHRLIDYNLILAKTRDLFKDNKDILDQYRFLYQSILVDEFQDTDPVQYEILQMLAEKHRNIFVVADDDQSIYAWRGAQPKNIRQFMSDFMIKEAIFLEHNYRCGADIMNTAQTVVQNTNRIEPDKTIESDNAIEAKIRAVFFSDESQEIQYTLKKINDWNKNHRVDFSEMAVIYPRHVFGDKLSNYFLRERLPFQQASGKNLLDHPVMKKTLLYLKLIRDPQDSLILEELVEKELGYHIYKQIQDVQNLKKITFRKALNDLSTRNEISYRVRNQLSTFIGNVANLVNLKSFFPFDRLMNEIIRGINELNESVLRFNTSKIRSASFKTYRQIAHPAVKIWLYADDDKMFFIASKMLERAFAKKIHRLEQEKSIHIDANDFAVLLNPLSTDTLPCRFALIFKETNDRRRGILSTLYRWLQSQLKSKHVQIFKNYTVFDLETTGKDPEQCGIVEIAAVKVRDGEIFNEFQTLINPGIPIEPGAQSVHHISDDDVKDAPLVQDAWKDFMNFIEDDLIIAHNGYAFDFKIMDRLARELTLPRLKNTRYDSLIFARNLYPNQQNSIDGLVSRFKLDAGTRHRALDDVRVLHKIFQELLRVSDSRETKILGEEFTEFVALGNLLENNLSAVEDKIFFMAGIRKLQSAYSLIRKAYADQFSINQQEFEDNLGRIAQRLNPSNRLYDTEDDFQRRILDTVQQFKGLQVDQAIVEFLSYVALVNPQDSLKGIDAVSLLTFHSAKGLEFDRVIIMGLEDDNMPSFFAYKKDDDDDRTVSEKIEEQKRLLYVGITRGKSEVVFTVVKNRFGRLQKSSPFLDEIKDKIEIKTYH